MLAGGSFPVRVRGAGVIGAITVSGLSSDEDHQLVVDGIRNYLKELLRERNFLTETGGDRPARIDRCDLTKDGLSTF